WTGNRQPRQAVFVRQTASNRYAVVFIGHRHNLNDGSWVFDEIPGSPAYRRPAYYARLGWRELRPWIEPIVSVSRDQLLEKLRDVPEQWLPNPDIVSGVVDQLLDRAARLTQIVAAYSRS